MHLEQALTLLLFALGAFLVPLGTGRVGLPAAVGEILFGVLIGPGVANLVHLDGFTTALTELGFCFLMFLAGLELDFAHLEKVGGRALALCAAAVAVIFLGAFGLNTVLGWPIYLVLVLGAMSIGIMLATLNELQRSRTPAGQLTILAGSLGEFVTIVLLTVFSFHHRFGLGLQLLVKLGELALVLAAAYAVLVLLRVLIWWWPERFTRVVTHRDPSEIGVRAGLATMLAFVALASLLGVEAILGAFVAGALFSFVFREKGALETKLASLGFGFFVPVFFITVGASFDLARARSTEALRSFGTLFAASTAVKLLPTPLFVVAGMRAREALGAGLLLGAPLTLLVAISRLGSSLGVLDSTRASAVILLAVGGGVVLPWLYRLLVRGA